VDARVHDGARPASAPPDDYRRELAALEKEIQLAKVRFGLPREAPVRSCYEAGRDGFWLHRWLIARDVPVENVVVDSSSIEVNRRARRAKTDRLDVGKLLALPGVCNSTWLRTSGRDSFWFHARAAAFSSSIARNGLV
jgi:hypothetical protein